MRIVTEQELKELTLENRKKMICAMEFLARNINDENICIDIWLAEGVADGDIPYGNFDTENVDDYYVDDEDVFNDITETFLTCMMLAKKDGLCVY